jgi:hypothetical protein
MTDLLSRRRFLLASGTGIAALSGLPGRLRADPYAPFPGLRRPRRAVRVRGRVTAAGRGLAGVAVSDGLAVTRTDREGRYSLVSDGSRPWVFVSLPRGCRIPVQPTGTSRLHQPLRPDSEGEARADFTLEPDEGGLDHRFYLLADPQTQDAFEMGRLHAETVPDVRGAALAAGGTAFGIACGDIMFDRLELFPEYERAVQAMGIPFFQVVGNHDLDFQARTTEASTATFERHFGPAWYSFDVGAVHYVVLNDVLWYGDGYVGYVTATQLAWLAADLAGIEAGRTVVVALHIPLASTYAARTGDTNDDERDRVNNREALLRLLEPYRAVVFSGHTHESETVTHGAVREYTLGAVCGAWWSGDICWDGTPNGFGEIEVLGEELRVRYRATGRPAAAQMALHPAGADPSAPDEMVANVWAWDPRWTVVWYENGERRGRMVRRPSLDPRAVREQRGPDLPLRRKWVEPARTAHMFFAPVGPDTREITVEATDPWGRVARETLPIGAGTGSR